ncbi:MAG: hypothetical protein ABH837_00975 [bacterium]
MANRRRPVNKLLSFSSYLVQFLVILVILGLLVIIKLPCVIGIQRIQNRGHISRIDRYFEEKISTENSEELSVVYPEITYTGFGVVSDLEILKWETYETNLGDSSRICYMWVLMNPEKEETKSILEESEIQNDNFWNEGVEYDAFGGSSTSHPIGFSGINSILLPLNNEAFELAIELKLRLPEEYSESNMGLLWDGLVRRSYVNPSIDR